ncbi:RNA polymerase sigma factor [Colwellia sp. UCD-KL20]|uniref:RNA polymerase sigma factor n=1 Tax=Colwellia sp. UCD-KL20 TaxID=1917165 RepID=UPI00097066C4|nr:RNA polymerase sigma factor [Colwellia sp. UCD-KL20]
MKNPFKGLSIAETFLGNEKIIKQFLRRFTSNKHDIEDICQEIVVRALEVEKSKKINEHKAFLFGISRNIVRTKLDKESKSIIDFIEDCTPKEYLIDEPTIEDSLDSRKRMLLFMEAVATLPRQCQKVFILNKVKGYSHKEIAIKLNISISTIEKHVALGLKRINLYIQNKAVEAPENSDIPSSKFKTDV